MPAGNANGAVRPPLGVGERVGHDPVAAERVGLLRRTNPGRCDAAVAPANVAGKIRRNRVRAGGCRGPRPARDPRGRSGCACSGAGRPVAFHASRLRERRRGACEVLHNRDDFLPQQDRGSRIVAVDLDRGVRFATASSSNSLRPSSARGPAGQPSHSGFGSGGLGAGRTRCIKRPCRDDGRRYRSRRRISRLRVSSACATSSIGSGTRNGRV